jgi:hypothetical protein
VVLLDGKSRLHAAIGRSSSFIDSYDRPRWCRGNRFASPAALIGLDPRGKYGTLSPESSQRSAHRSRTRSPRSAAQLVSANVPGAERKPEGSAASDKGHD